MGTSNFNIGRITLLLQPCPFHTPFTRPLVIHDSDVLLVRYRLGLLAARHVTSRCGVVVRVGMRAIYLRSITAHNVGSIT